MSYVVETAGDKYRGGYASSSSFDPEVLRVATSTFENYVGGTVLIVFLVFFVFLFLTAFTYFLMCYARYLKLRRPATGFYDPPPMLLRSSAKKDNGQYNEYSSLQRRLPSALSQAMSQQSEVL